MLMHCGVSKDGLVSPRWDMNPTNILATYSPPKLKRDRWNQGTRLVPAPGGTVDPDSGAAWPARVPCASSAPRRLSPLAACSINSSCWTGGQRAQFLPSCCRTATKSCQFGDGSFHLTRRQIRHSTASP